MVQKVWRRKNKKTNNIGTQSAVCNAPCTGCSPFNLHKDVTHTVLFFSLSYCHTKHTLSFPIQRKYPSYGSILAFIYHHFSPLDGNMFRKGYLLVSQIPLLRASEFYTW